MQFGLKQNVIDLIREQLELNPKIEEVVLYGSRAKGNYRPGSDIDLTLKGEELSVKDLISLENQMEDLPIPFKFDISLYHRITNPDLLDHIQRVGILFYKRHQAKY